MPVVKTPAVILHAFPYGDTSRILRLLTPDYGLRSVIAKGARSARSRFGGLLDPFTQGEAQFNMREGRDLFTLTSFALTRSRQGIGRDLSSFTGASLLAEIALRAGTEEPDPGLFLLLSDSLDKLTNPGDSPETTALAAVWSLVGAVGFQPEMFRCVRCGRELGDDEVCRFDVAEGGVACRRCRPTGRLLEPSVRREVADLSRGHPIDISRENQRVHGALIEAFLPAYLSPERGMKSLALFRQQMG